MKTYLSSFDQIRIIPQVSGVDSRNNCNTQVKLFNHLFELPLISASMHSLVDETFIDAMELEGSGVVQPRNMFITCHRPMYSTSVSNALNVCEYITQRGLIDALLFIEIAHGALDKMAWIRAEINQKYPYQRVIGGTIDNYNTGWHLQEWGYDGVLVNVGGGSVCLTTPYTGVGLPLVGSLLDIQENGGLKVPLIVAGGVKTIGDFVKCIALGVDVVMSGGLFKNCIDTLCAKTSLYYGEASEKHKGDRNHIEGKIEIVDTKDEYVKDVLKLAKESLQSAMSYSDSFTIKEFQSKVKLARLI